MAMLNDQKVINQVLFIRAWHPCWIPPSMRARCVLPQGWHPPRPSVAGYWRSPSWPPPAPRPRDGGAPKKRGQKIVKICQSMHGHIYIYYIIYIHIYIYIYIYITETWVWQIGDHMSETCGTVFRNPQVWETQRTNNQRIATTEYPLVIWRSYWKWP